MKHIQLDTIQDLEENEFLLKVYEHRNPNYPDYDHDLGFMTKLNKDGSIPKAFNNWKPNYREPVKESYLMKEFFRDGWRVDKYRTGKSQDWIKVKHPLGFIVEIYMSNFFEIMECTVIDNMELIGKFRWENKKLIKED